jgi:uncharacterized protein YkwD
MNNLYSKLLFSLLFVVIITISNSCSNESLDIQHEDNEALNPSIENQIFKLVNDHRIDIGKQALKQNSFANSLAKEHTLYMIDEKKISHDNFDQRFEKLSSTEKAFKIGENVASGQKTAQSVMNSWLNSSGHRKNIEGDFTHIGISAIKNKSDIYYFTQLFFKK